MLIISLMTNTKQDIEIPAEIARPLVEVRKKLAIAGDALDELEKKVRAGLARGTREIAPPRTSDGTVAARVERILRLAAMTPAELALAAGATQNAVDVAVRAAGKKIANVGLPGAPRLSWVAGDDGPTADLNELVVRLLQVRPMTFAEVIDFTGAREKRVSGAIVRIQRDDRLRRRLVNRGTSQRALWFIKAR